MKTTTLCFLLKDDQVLLAMKKRGFGVGKWNGTGGKVKDEETVEGALIREVREEIGVGIVSGDFQKTATLNFQFQDNPNWNQVCHVFCVHHWTGDPTESEEMKPQWFPINQLPFSEMWIDDPDWLPLVLAGKKIDADFLFDAKGDFVLNFSVREL